MQVVISSCDSQDNLATVYIVTTCIVVRVHDIKMAVVPWTVARTYRAWVGPGGEGGGGAQQLSTAGSLILS